MPALVIVAVLLAALAAWLLHRACKPPSVPPLASAPAATFLTKPQQRALMAAAEVDTSVAAMHAAPTHVQFDATDQRLRKRYHTQHGVVAAEVPFLCYSCGRATPHGHRHYLFCCPQCGKTFWKLRHASRDLTHHVALVTGGRTKLGHQVVLKLLRAHATVVATTRRPDAAVQLFRQYPDSAQWLHRLRFEALDLTSPDLAAELQRLYVALDQRHGRLDVVVNCAAQTIRCRDVPTPTRADVPLNRYGDWAYVPAGCANSWQATVADTTQGEMEEVFRVNAVAPFLVLQRMSPLLANSAAPFLINVHAREGLFNVRKHYRHVHTNMAKAACAMLTRSLAYFRFPGHQKRLRVHGCDPGWISADEYHLHGSVWEVPPLDERDGAARVLYPLMANIHTNTNTRRHFFQILN